MESNQQNNQIAGAITFPRTNGDGGGEVQHVPIQPRQPRNLQGLLRFAMEATKAEDAPGNSELGPMDEERRIFLEQALKNLTVDLAQIMQESIKILTDSDKMSMIRVGDPMPDDVVSAFDNLMDVVNDIDVAKDFYNLGGYAIFPICYASENASVRACASSLLAELVQNHPLCQAKALEFGLLNILLSFAENDQGHTLSKTLYAISCMTREFEPACKLLVQNGGCLILMQLLTNPDSTVRTKSAFLIRYLCQHWPEAREQFIEKNIVKILTELIIKGRDSTSEHILGTFLALVESLDPVALRQCRDPELGLQGILEEYLKDPIFESDMYLEEKEYCGELLKLLFANWNPTEEVVDR